MAANVIPPFFPSSPPPLGNINKRERKLLRFFSHLVNKHKVCPPRNTIYSLPLLQQQQLVHRQQEDEVEEEVEEVDLASEEEEKEDDDEVGCTSFYVPLLQQCVDRNSVRSTRTIHGHLIKTGSHRDLFLSTSLVNAYCKCGSVEDARKLFDELPRRNIVTWTALITGLNRNSQPDQASLVFLQLLSSGAYPTNYTLGAALSSCSASYDRQLGRQIHGYIIKYGVACDTSVANSLTSFYAKFRELEPTLRVFDSISDKNVISWTTIISGCSDNGHAELGLRIFIDMLLEGARPNEFTLTSAMSLCCVIQSLALGKQIHALCIKFGCESSLPVRNSVMYLYMKCGKIDEARKLILDTEAINLITWNAMIAGHAQLMDLTDDGIAAYHRGVEAFEIFLRLNRSDMKPDLFSYSSILTVCSGLAALEQGEQVHAQITKSGYLSDVVVSSALVNMYSKCGSIEDAGKAFVEMPTRTMISWTSMIAGYSQHGRAEEAILLFEDMRLAGVRPNQVTFVAVLSACSHSGLVDKAEYYFKMMKDEYGIKLVMDHYACMVDMFVRLGRLDEALGFIKTMDFEPNEVLWTIVLAGSRSQGRMDLAFYAADRLLQLKPRCPETYTLLQSMYVSAERWQDVSRVRKIVKEEQIGSMNDWSWISIKDKIHSFRADDRSLSQSVQMQDLLGSLLEKAKGMCYIAQRSSETFQEDGRASVVHHSEKLAIIFGLMNTSDGATIRVVKNTTICGDCHSVIKFFSILTRREIIVRDSKRLHRFKEGRCSCGDFTMSI